MVVQEEDEGVNFHKFDIGALELGENYVDALVKDEHGMTSWIQLIVILLETDDYLELLEYQSEYESAESSSEESTSSSLASAIATTVSTAADCDNSEEDSEEDSEEETTNTVCSYVISIDSVDSLSEIVA